MGTQLWYGTAGATGGGWASQPGSLQPAFVESRHEPRWQWQCRSPKTWKDRNCWVSLWSRGQFSMCANDGSFAGTPIGSDYSGAMGYEPFSCDGEGTQSVNFLRGTCKDSVGAAVASAIVQGFRTSDDFYLGEVTGAVDGTYTLGVHVSKTTACYLVAYKAGSPDIAGTTVNTLLPTNVDGT